MNGRVATVLGVGPGLGAAVARRFAGESFAVAMMARREESLAEIKQDIEGDGGRALPVSADATDANSVAAAFERVRTELGDPEVLVYNAGAFQMGGVLEISPAQFDECFKANCAGAFYAAREVLPASGVAVSIATPPSRKHAATTKYATPAPRAAITPPTPSEPTSHPARIATPRIANAPTSAPGPATSWA